MNIIREGNVRDEINLYVTNTPISTFLPWNPSEYCSRQKYNPQHIIPDASSGSFPESISVLGDYSVHAE